jgi:transposase
VRSHCPNAAIVFDLFHVVAKYGREVIDRVRVDRANELRDDRPGRKIVKGARWLLLKNRDSLRPGEDVALEELLAANHELFVVYVLRDALKELWRYRHAGYAARAWRSWYRKAMRSRIELWSALTRSRGRPQIFVMQAAQHRSGAHAEALAEPMAG